MSSAQNNQNTLDTHYFSKIFDESGYNYHEAHERSSLSKNAFGEPEKSNHQYYNPHKTFYTRERSLSRDDSENDAYINFRNISNDEFYESDVEIKENSEDGDDELDDATEEVEDNKENECIVMLKCDVIPLNNDVDDDMEVENDKKERKTGAIRPKKYRVHQYFTPYRF